ncbi:hypothetical protein FH972_021184 [Carpinus fangiana]|uniref:Exocyst complex component Sec3 PIP2-binding N-terminal domain-containing protein n=1 Tax=Carpinus fangiana TaxID=176857 RepID=A0A5N6KNZ6_9ROSI|nr:hypothetical protein FH972_021184 [Carpinus fangiana]
MDARRPYANGFASAQTPPRSAGMDSAARPDPLRPSQATSSQAMSRAQKFDDEKRRITESCFSKNDEKGRPLQNYITHVRVEEDGMYPTGPPPPDANPQYKKSRVIIIAVKNTGRVWVHKARENADGTFQIGKSWPMEDLTALEVFSPQPGQSLEVQQRTQWAGSVGFVVTMGKPYYWAASTSKEKDFFAASLVKIYRKYTAGKVPQLTGFGPAEINDIMGGTPAQEPPLQIPVPPQPQFANQTARGQSPTSRKQIPSQEPSQRRPISPETAPPFPQGGSPSQRPPSPLRHRNITPMSDYGRPTTSSSTVYSRDASAHYPPQSRDGATPSLRTQHSNDSSLRKPPATEPLQPPPRLRSPPAPQAPGISSYASHPALSDARSHAGDFRGPSSHYDAPGASNGHGPRDVYTTPPESIASQSVSSLHGSVSDVGSQHAAPQAIPERRRPPLQDGYARSRGDTMNGSGGYHGPVAAAAAATPNQELGPSPLGSSGPASFDQRGANDPTPAPLQPRNADSPSRAPPPDSEQTRQYRPGLGPMTGRTKQEETANKLRKAATAAGAFKPRAGGAGARLLANKNKKSEDDTSLNEVVPAPSASRNMSGDSLQQTPIDKIAEKPPTIVKEPAPEVQVSSPVPMTPQEEPRAAAREPVGLGIDPNVPTETQPSDQPPQPIKKPRSNKYDAAFGMLDIDPTIFVEQQREYETILSDFGWEKSILSGKKVDALETDLRREIARLEAGSWLGSSDQKDDRVDFVQKMLDKAIAECDEMEGLLTLYGVELGTLNSDVSYIEAQSHGLQIQTANQKALQTRLHDLVDTVSIDASQLEPLRRASISDTHGLESVEICLVQLYEALATIDPSMIRGRSLSAQENDSLNTMRSLQERKDVYLNEVYAFLDRLRQYMDPTFATAFKKTMEMVSRSNSGVKGNTTLDVASHDLARAALWQYSPLMLFVKEIEPPAWDSVMQIYTGRAGGVYRTEFVDNIAAWKKTARKPTGAEQQALFTAQEVEKSDGMIRSAQKLTVKRSQMLARGLRTGTFEKKTKVTKDPNAKYDPFETLAGALDEMLPVMTCEQNFVVDFFHASSSEAVDFPEFVASSPPGDRRGTNLFARKPVEPNRDMANRVLRSMEQIYTSWPTEMQSFIDWAVTGNELQAIGIICAIERSLLFLSDTSQEFITRTLQKLLERLAQLFIRTIDAQIRAIEDTKVKIKKRKGVIHFMKVFPNFSAVVESMLPPADSPDGELEIRSMVDKAYTRINKAMFDSLKVIAKESPVGGQATSTDPDDKEALNYHILLIENMHHYKEEVLEHGDAVLGEWRGKAMLEMAEHQELYVAAIIRRPLGRLLDFVESVESLLAASAAARATPAGIPGAHPSHARAVFKKTLAAHTAKDVRKGVDALRLRVEKHFGDADEPGLSQRLVGTILDDCERRYIDVAERTRVIARDVYEGTVEVEFGRADVQSAFRR